jgi:hypothetical protein
MPSDGLSTTKGPDHESTSPYPLLVEEGGKADGSAKGEGMSFARQIYQPVLFLMAGLALLLGSSAEIATGEPPKPPMGLAQVKSPTPMPTFTLPAMNGEAFDSSKLQGKVVVVRFWATW